MLRYHFYVIPNENNVKDAIAFPLGSSLNLKMLGSTENHSAQRSMSREKSDSESFVALEINKRMLEVSIISIAYKMRNFIDFEIKSSALFLK